MNSRIPLSIIFVDDDAAVLSPMCAAVFLAFCGGKATSISAASKELASIHPLAAKACRGYGIEVDNHRRVTWSEELSLKLSPDLVVAVTPGAQHVVLEATRNQHIDVDYWPLHYPSDEKQFVDLLEHIRNQLVDRFGIGKNWSDVSSLPSLSENWNENSESFSDGHIVRAERVALVKDNLERRPVEISSYLTSLRILIEEKIKILEGNKPNDPMSIEEWQVWYDFLLNLQSTVVQLSNSAKKAISEVGDADVLAEQTQSALDLYKSNFLEWPRENVKEVVDGTFRASLVGCCAVVGSLFGQPIAGALIGSAIFGGPKVGKAIGDAIKSGSS